MNFNYLLILTVFITVLVISDSAKRRGRPLNRPRYYYNPLPMEDVIGPVNSEQETKEPEKSVKDNQDGSNSEEDDNYIRLLYNF